MARRSAEANAPRRWTAPVATVTAVLPAVVAGVLDLLVWQGDRDLAWGGQLPVWVVPVTTVALCVALLGRRRHPLPVFTLLVAYPLVNLAVPHYESFAPLLVALYTVAARCPPRPARLALLACAVPFGLYAYRYADLGTGGGYLGRLLGSALALTVIAGGAWGLGRLAHLAERRAEAAREQALVQERLRLARELHDSVTGAVTAMILHAAGARAHLPAEAAEVHEALGVVEQAGAQAIEELHRMLGLLRTPDGRAAVDAAGTARPELTSLAVLVERARRDGLEVSVEHDGRPQPLEPAVEQAAYRVVQEALTNAVKYTGRGGRAGVRLAWRPDGLDLHVHSGGGGGARPGVAALSSGVGLTGLRERVHLVGGVLDAGRVEGGWLVHARLPLSVPVPSPAPAEGVGA